MLLEWSPILIRGSLNYIKLRLFSLVVVTTDPYDSTNIEFAIAKYIYFKYGVFEIWLVKLVFNNWLYFAPPWPNVKVRMAVV